MRLKHANLTPEPRRGIVLLAVLVVVVLLSLAAYQYSDLMVAEYSAQVNAHRAAQAKAFADSGIHYAAALISNPETRATLSGNIYDNAEAFRDIAVGGDETKRTSGRFTLIAPADADESTSATWRNGVTDEAGKININAFMKRDAKGQILYDALLKLPNMTQELAASIVDWVDPDSEPRQGGAENDYYSGESLPYRAKNAPLDSLDELLLVKGMTREILYGSDLNRNGIQDADEGSGDEGFSRGLAAYLTVYGREQNSDAAGQALTYVNETDLAAFYEKLAPSLGDDLAKFVVMVRQYGPTTTSGDQKTTEQSKGKGKNKGKGGGSTQTKKGKLADWTPDFTKKEGQKQQKISSLFDLIDAQVSIPGKERNDPATVYTSPLKETGPRRDLLPKLFEHVTIFEESDIPPRVNVNTAPREVVAALPDLSEADVQSIIALRPKLSATEPPSAIYDTPAWLLTEANLKPETLKKIEKNITTRSQVYHVQVIGFFDGGGQAARIEAVIDTNAGRPRILMWRDLTELGGTKIVVP